MTQLNTLAKTGLLPTRAPLQSTLNISVLRTRLTSVAQGALNRVRVALYGPALTPRKPDATILASFWGGSFECVREDVQRAVQMSEVLSAIRFTSRPDHLIYFAEQAANVELAPL